MGLFAVGKRPVGASVAVFANGPGVGGVAVAGHGVVDARLVAAIDTRGCARAFVPVDLLE